MTRTTLLALSALLLAPLLAPSAHAQTPVVRINAGGPTVAPPSGPPFTADVPYQPGVSPAGYVLGAPADDDPIGGFLNPHAGVQRTAREGWRAWRVEVPPGDYVLRLHFAEVGHFVHGPGLREFDVAVEGQPLFDALDVAETFGNRYGGEVARLVHVADGRLDVETGDFDAPSLLNALEVWTAPPAFATPAPPANVVARDSYGRTVLTWTPATEPEHGGWRVYASGDDGGPFELLAELPSAPARFLDDVPVLAERRYRVSSLDVAGNESAQSSAVKATSQPASTSGLPVFSIDIDPALLQVLDADPWSNDELPATFSYEGETWDVEVRYRGSGSRDKPKKSWKVEFPSLTPFQGRVELNLKAFFLDPTLIKEPLIARTLRDVGNAAPELRRALLFVNGVYSGVYADVEEVDQRFLAARDRTPGASLFKCGAQPGLPADLTPLGSLDEYAELYEQKTGPPEALAELAAFAELVSDPATTTAELADAFHADDFLTWLAAITWATDTAHNGGNYYLLLDPALDRWEWVNWDNDRSFFDAAAPVLLGTSFCPTCPGDVNNVKESVLRHDLLRERYLRKLGDLIAGAGEPSAFAATVDDEHARILAAAHADVAKDGWEHPDTFDAGLPQLQSYGSLRAAAVAAELATLLPIGAPRPRINELLVADGDALGALDEQGEAEPWLELFHAGAQPFDLSGHHLTDDLGAPTRWTFPAGTVVPAGGRVAVWLDGEPGDGPLHASFRPASQGGELGLFAPGGAELLDFLHFGPQQAGVALGPASDGGAFPMRLATPTHAAPNTGAGNLPPKITWVEAGPLPLLASVPIEVTCRASDADTVAAVTLTWRANGGAWQTLSMQPLDADRWRASLPGQPDGAFLEYWIEAVDALGRPGVHPFAGEAAPHALPIGGAASGVVIAELLADNENGILDEAGQNEDWIELWNTGAAAIDLSGYTLSDDLLDPAKWTLPAGTVLPPGGRAIVFCDEDPGDGPLHADFKLSKGGEAAALFAPVSGGSELIDALVFGPLDGDVACGRLAPGSATSYRLLDPSPGAPNAPVPGAAVRYAANGPVAAEPPLAILNATAGPVIGAAFALALDGAAPSAPGLLAAGFAPKSAAFAPHGTLLVQPLAGLTLPLATDGAGAATVAVPLPNDAGLVGLTLYLQAYAAGSGLSTGLAATIGG